MGTKAEIRYDVTKHYCCLPIPEHFRLDRIEYNSPVPMRAAEAQIDLGWN